MLWLETSFEHCIKCPCMAELDELPGVMYEKCFRLSIDLLTFINLGHYVYSGRGPCNILPSMLIKFGNYDNLYAILSTFCIQNVTMIFSVLKFLNIYITFTVNKV